MSGVLGVAAGAVADPRRPEPTGTLGIQRPVIGIDHCAVANPQHVRRDRGECAADQVWRRSPFALLGQRSALLGRAAGQPELGHPARDGVLRHRPAPGVQVLVIRGRAVRAARCRKQALDLLIQAHPPLLTPVWPMRFFHL
nr:hypothetical protein [Microbispora sp. GKU 823]